jgi:hypothetical protein
MGAASTRRCAALGLLALMGCAAASAPATPPETASASAVPASSVSPALALASATPEVASLSSEPPSAAAGASRDTLCEKALFELERAAAPAIDACLGRHAHPQQPITIQVLIDGAGLIAETKWDPSTTTGFGTKAAFCVLKAVKAVAFDEPACSKETLMVRRAAAPSLFDARL